MPRLVLSLTLQQTCFRSLLIFAPCREAQVEPFQTVADSWFLLPLFFSLASFVFVSLQVLLPKHRGWVPLRHLRSVYLSVLSSCADFQNLCFDGLANPFSRNLSLHIYTKPPCVTLSKPLHDSSTFTLLDSYTLLFRLDFVPRTKYSSTANYFSRECVR
jgi:hypothetical protein